MPAQVCAEVGVAMGLLQRLELRQGQSLVDDAAASAGDQAAAALASRPRRLCRRRARAQSAPRARRAESTAPADDPAPSRGRIPAREAARTLDPGRAEFAREPMPGSTTSFGEMPVPRRSGAERELVPLAPSPWSGSTSGFDDDGPDLEATLAPATSLAEHLERQLDLATADPRRRLIGRHLIHAIDEAGYLTEAIDGDRRPPRARRRRRRKGARGLIQTFEPAGIGARNLAECLAIQLKERDRYDPAMQALLARLDLVATARSRGAAAQSAASTTRISPTCWPRSASSSRSPAAPSAGVRSQVLVPDVLVRVGRRRRLGRRAQPGHPAPGPRQPGPITPGWRRSRASDEDKSLPLPIACRARTGSPAASTSAPGRS